MEYQAAFSIGAERGTRSYRVVFAKPSDQCQSMTQPPHAINVHRRYTVHTGQDMAVDVSGQKRHRRITTRRTDSKSGVCVQGSYHEKTLTARRRPGQ